MAVADLEVDGDELVLHLRSLARRPRACTAISGCRWRRSAWVHAVDDPWSEFLRGIRAPGTGLPKVIAIGTRRGGFGKDFAAVHGKGPAVVVELENTEYGRLVVTADDAAGPGHDHCGGGGAGAGAGGGSRLGRGGDQAPSGATEWFRKPCGGPLVLERAGVLVALTAFLAGAARWPWPVWPAGVWHSSSRVGRGGGRDAGAAAPP